jgi:hypothetical protein
MLSPITRDQYRSSFNFTQGTWLASPPGTNVFATATVLAGVCLSYSLDELSSSERRSHLDRPFGDAGIV